MRLICDGIFSSCIVFNLFDFMIATFGCGLIITFIHLKLVW